MKTKISVIFAIAIIGFNMQATQMERKQRGAKKRVTFALNGACVTPYFWDKNGQTWFLVGKEKSDKVLKWHSFCVEEIGTEKPLDAAIAKAQQETGNTLDFVIGNNQPPITPFYGSYTDDFYTISDKLKDVKTLTSEFLAPDVSSIVAEYLPKQPYNVIYFVRVSSMTDPAVIKEKMQHVKKRERKKTEWKWINAEALMRWTAKKPEYHEAFPSLDLPFFHHYLDEISHPAIQRYMQQIINAGKSFGPQIHGLSTAQRHPAPRASEGERKVARTIPEERERKVSRAPAQGTWTSQHDAIVNALNQFANHMLVGQTDLALADIEKATSLVRAIKPADVAAQNKNGSTLFDIAANVSQTVGQLPSSVRGKWNSLVNKLIG